MKNTLKEYYIIDFDSTFIKHEALEKLAEIALVGNPQKNDILLKITALTKLGMEGKIPFSQSLVERLKLITIKRDHINKLISLLKRSVTGSVIRNKKFFKTYKNNIYIISGGFIDFIEPVVEPFGIDISHILANKFLFKGNTVIGIDKDNPLSKTKGKVEAIRKLKLPGSLIVVGDGYTDYEIKKEGFANKFYIFCENVKREDIIKYADRTLLSFDDLLYIKKLPRRLSYPKSKIKVLLLENISETAVNKFIEEGYQITKLKEALGTEELIKHLTNTSILGIRSKTQITKEVLTHAPKLVTIGAFCIGVNQLDLTSCAEKGIAVFNAPYSNTRSVVELIIGEIIMLYRNTFTKSMLLHQGIWDKSAADSHEIRGKTLGIIGYGNIGSQISPLAEMLGMKVLFYDIADKLALGNAQKCKKIQEVLTQSDVITLHVDGRKENTNLISHREFKLMKNGVLLLNASRGHVIDIKALSENIKSGKVRGAAIDVYPQEPKSNKEKFASILQNLPNIILTPHIGGSTLEAQNNIGEFVSDKIINYINTGDTFLSVNFPHVQLPKLKNAHRVMHIHNNVPGVIAKINKILANYRINVEGQYLKTTETIGYVITDINKVYDNKLIKELRDIEETIKLRVLY